MFERPLALALCLLAAPTHAADEIAPPGGTLAGSVPGGAIAFFETAGLGDLVRKVGEWEVFQSVLAGEDFERLKATRAFKEATSARKFAEFVLRMSIWEASDRLLGGRLAVAAYPPADGGRDPNVVLLLRPAQPSGWLKTRIRFAPLVRLGLKRIGRREFGSQVTAYRTRGDKGKATYFGFHDGWIAVSTRIELLRGTVALQDPGDIDFDRPEPLQAEAAFEKMSRRMGEGHMARAFIDTRRLTATTGEKLGLPEEIGDPVLALFLGGVVELVDHSRYAGFTLDLDDRQLSFEAGIDARPEDVGERYRLFFAGSPDGGITALPEVPGYIGGFSLYRPFGDWYRQREGARNGTLIPGMASFEEKVGDLLLGPGAGRGGLVGDKIAFVAAHADDAGADPAGIRLPGFAFVVDIAEPEGADEALRSLFEASLAEISVAGEKGEAVGWEVSRELAGGVEVLFAEHPPQPGSPPLVPAGAQVGRHFVISPSRQLCTALVEVLRGGGPGAQADRDLAFDLRFTELSKFFAANREQYEVELVRVGRSPLQAERDYANVAKLLSSMESLSGGSSSADGIFKFEARGTFR